MLTSLVWVSHQVTMTLYIYAVWTSTDKRSFECKHYLRSRNQLLHLQHKPPPPPAAYKTLKHIQDLMGKCQNNNILLMSQLPTPPRPAPPLSLQRSNLHVSPPTHTHIYEPKTLHWLSAAHPSNRLDIYCFLLPVRSFHHAALCCLYLFLLMSLLTFSLPSPLCLSLLVCLFAFPECLILLLVCLFLVWLSYISPVSLCLCFCCDAV